MSQIGLLVACYQGYVDVVIALSQCPYLDVNWQDSEGNTALITAAQAGNTHTHKKHTQMENQKSQQLNTDTSQWLKSKTARHQVVNLLICNKL